jgi:hypothetical protein
LRKERSFAELKARFPRQQASTKIEVKVQHLTGPYCMDFWESVLLVFGTNFEARYNSFIEAVRYGFWESVQLQKWTVHTSRGTTCIPRQRGTVFEVHLLHINLYIKLKKKGTIF